LKGLDVSEPCDDSFIGDDFKLPSWFDEAKFKRFGSIVKCGRFLMFPFCRGQKYFSDNRIGIMTSNIFGLFALISEPEGAQLLDQTEKSSTADAAKKRYISSTVHMLSWYSEELKPGSK
jgi:hypothetical protein